MKLSTMTRTATLAATLAMMAAASEAGPIRATQQLFPNVRAIGSVDAAKPLQLSIPDAGWVQVSAGRIAPGRLLRVIAPSGRTLKVIEADAQRKFSFRVDRAGVYRLGLIEANPIRLGLTEAHPMRLGLAEAHPMRVGLGQAKPQLRPTGGLSGLQNASARRQRCGFNAREAEVSLLFSADSAGSAGGIEPGPVTGGDCTLGGDLNSAGSQDHANASQRPGGLGARKL